MPLSPVDILSNFLPLPRLRDLTTRRAYLDSYLEHFNERVTGLAAQLRAGQIDVDRWELAMRAELRNLHVNALIVAHGGERGAVTFTEWGRLGGHVRVQYRYLHRYAEQIQQSAVDALAGTGTFYSEKYLAWRSRLYGGNARASFYRGMAMGLLDQVPGDGQTQCGTNCKCELEFEEGGRPGLLLVFWRLRPAEHCDDCVQLSEDWNPYELWLPVGLSAREWEMWLPRMATPRMEALLVI